MPRHKLSSGRSPAMLALGAVLLATNPALAAKASLKSMSFSAEGKGSTIHVISTGKKKWDTIKVGNVEFGGDMKVNTKYPGYVEDVGVVLGNCGDNGCTSMPQIWSAQIVERDYYHTEDFSFSASEIPVSGTGISLGDPIIARCNEHLQADGPTKRYSFSYELDATFIVDSEETWGDVDRIVVESDFGEFSVGEVDHARTDSFPVQVVCDPVVKPASDDLAYDFGEFDIKNVKLFLTTYQPGQPGANPGTVCPSFKVTSRAQTNQAGPVTMRIWRQKDGGPITSDVVQAWASYSASKNGYFATWEKWEDVGTTSYFQYKTEIVEDSPFAPFDGWKDITVHCTGGGGGGFTDNQDDPNDGLPQPQAKWQGELTIADSAGADKHCPREGQVFFAVTQPEPGDFTYRIQCSNGAFFTGTATGYDQGSGIFEAYGAHNISINRTRSISCTLQELTPAPVTVATDKEDFTCANPTFDPGAEDFTADDRPDTSTPIPPLVLVDPTPDCAPNERIVRGRCVDKPIVQACKSNEKLVGGKCIGISIHCLPGFHQEGLKCVKNEKPDVSILCKPGFVLKGKTCVRKPDVSILCKPGFVLKGKTCVRKPEVSILCKPGFVLRGKTCVRKPEVSILCKPGFVLKGKTCVRKPEVSILCKPGFVLKGKTCVRKPVIATACGRGEKLVRGHCVEVTKPVAKVKRFAAPKQRVSKPTVLKALKSPKAFRALRRN
jgi:hypothetical protein